MNIIKELLRRAVQPAGVAGIAGTITIALAVFGLNLTPEMALAVAGVVGAGANVLLIVLDTKVISK